MLKKLFLLICFFSLSNCSTPTTALLGPIFTGAKTGSVYHASVSYGGNQIIDKIRKTGRENNFNKINNFKSNLLTQNKYHLRPNFHETSKN